MAHLQIYESIWAMKPKDTLDAWQRAKIDPNLTYERCENINNDIYLIRTEQKLSEALYAELDIASRESYVKMQELWPAEHVRMREMYPDEYMDEEDRQAMGATP